MATKVLQSRPFVEEIFLHGAIKITSLDEKNAFEVKGQRLKPTLENSSLSPRNSSKTSSVNQSHGGKQKKNPETPIISKFMKKEEETSKPFPAKKPITDQTNKLHESSSQKLRPEGFTRKITIKPRTFETSSQIHFVRPNLKEAQRPKDLKKRPQIPSHLQMNR
ncbi:uncharacterized protein E6C27_scaffold428G00370 [Cucumis melo var. makuwa]|uniref:Uncharacterized protein n=1 Tax=Cucumis melo var. makuwa TaxID=1194695 RepID=A0A5A7UE85_CUCMM|nr:uncharacterized protein E6C27_scaffold428G00370 [Cucumis melo var. makuwa]